MGDEKVHAKFNQIKINFLRHHTLTKIVVRFLLKNESAYVAFTRLRYCVYCVPFLGFPSTRALRSLSLYLRVVLIPVGVCGNWNISSILSIMHPLPEPFLYQVVRNGGGGGGGGVRRGASANSTKEFCIRLENAKNLADDNKIAQASHVTRLEYSVGGGLVAAIALLFVFAWAKTRYLPTCNRTRTRSATYTKNGFFWFTLFGLILTAVIIRSALKNLQPEKDYRKLLGDCRKKNILQECRSECSDYITNLTFQNILFVAIPLGVILAGVFFYSLHLRGALRQPHSHRRVPRRRPFTGGGAANTRGSSDGNPGRITFAHPRGNVAVLAVAVPPNTRRPNSNFKVTLVQPNDDVEQGQGDIEHDTSCAICLGEMESKNIGEIRCGHRFHHSCISDWLRKALRPTCPLCKAIVGDEDPDEDSPVA